MFDIFGNKKQNLIVSGVISYSSAEQIEEAQAEFEVMQEVAKKKADAKAKSDLEEKKKKANRTQKQIKADKIASDNEIVFERGPFKKTETSLKVPTFDVTPKWDIDPETNEIVWETKPSRIIYNGPEKLRSEDYMDHPVEVMVFSLMGSPLRSDEGRGIGIAGI